MRVYSTRPRIRHPWSDADRNTAAAMLLRGSDYRAIAAALGRKPDAVNAWVHHYLKALSRSDLPKPELPTVAIRRDAVPEWYLLGWRFTGFDGDFCIFEWPCSGEPKRPQTVRPERELEAA